MITMAEQNNPEYGSMIKGFQKSIQRTAAEVKTSVLIVESENETGQSLKNLLKNLGYNVLGVISTGETSLKSVVESAPDITLIDLKLKGIMGGISTATYIFHAFNRPVIFIVKGLDTETTRETIERAKVADAFGCIVLPCSEMQIYGTVELALSAFIASSSTQAGETIGLTKRDLQRLIHIDEGFVLLDMKGRILFMNPFAEYLSEYSYKESLLHQIHEIFSMSDGVSGHKMEDDLWNGVREGFVTALSKQMTLFSKNGNRRIVMMKVVPLRNRRDQLISLVIHMRQVFSKGLTY